MNKKISKNKYLLLTAILVSAVFILVGCDEKDPVANNTTTTNNTNNNNQTENITQNQQNQANKLNLDNLPVEEIKLKEEDYKGWKTYRNEEAGFEIKYPGNWEYQEGRKAALRDEGDKVYPVTSVDFGLPKSMQSGGLWGVYFKDRATHIDKRINGVKNKIEENYQNVSIKKVSFNDLEAYLVEADHKEIDYYKYRGVYVRGFDFSMNMIGDSGTVRNFPVKEDYFDKFYSSFKLIEKN